MLLFFKFIIKYAWFIGVVVGIINVLVIKMRVISALKKFQITAEESQKVMKVIGISFTIPLLIIGILQLIGGFSNAFFIFSNDYKNIFIIFSWINLFIWWSTLLYWVIFRNGARVLVNYHKIIGNGIPGNILLVKIFVSLMVLCGITALILGAVKDVYGKISFE